MLSPGVTGSERMVQAEDRRMQLAEFLKLRRGRLLPAEMGFPDGPRRRTPGLRREELAAAPGIGLTWYTALEQAKPIRVSAGFLDNLARALRLSGAERAHLFALAHHRPPPFLPGREDGALQLQPMLDAVASPAYARTAWFDVLGWNVANTRQFGDFAAVPVGERNVLRLFFTRGYHRRVMLDWETDAAALVAKFRLAFGETATAEPFQPVLDDLLAASADFRRLWAAHEVSNMGEGVTRLVSPRHGAIRFRHYTLVPEAMPDLCIVIYTPSTDDACCDQRP